MKNILLCIVPVLFIACAPRYGTKTDYSDHDGVFMQVIESIFPLEITPFIQLDSTDSAHVKNPDIYAHPDMSRSVSFGDGYRTIKTVQLLVADIHALKKQMRQKKSYEAVPSAPTSYDLRFQKYHNGKLQWKMMISMQTDHFQFSKTIYSKVRKEGIITTSFKTYLVALLEKYEMSIAKVTE